ncbi:NAD(P)H-dependent oxidoreductase subunit E [Alkalibacter rhizosphaerae]|uniref:NAD(P)H-dependent oxidoreductase subunit E n=1 Tax=Alkalibacter rhizosphaerae TaxID=2815577 RepID=A0A975AIV1_9FIRM|nr:NAD(P)H-dependent oxidoreductase subunit E [Alkalibacter rhizosphaerae]QSX09054.1 NAD(P)H-dependent oxidoreductase subunit E [Alkalibacter rhizosphaerae]
MERSKLAKVKLPKEKLLELDAYMDSLEDKEGLLIHILHKAQEIFGYLSLEVQLYISKRLGIPAAKVFGIVTFYSFFTQEPRGKHTISMCMGTACFVKGADRILEKICLELGVNPGETSSDGLFTVKDVRCIGACGLAPVAMIDDKVYGHLTEESVKEILDVYRKEEQHENQHAESAV